MLDDIKNSTDLANLKERINNCSDEELAAAMEEEWLHGIIPDSGISDEDLARIKAEIHEQIGTRKQFTLKRVLKWTQIAAAIALPICMVIMGMMYKENRQYAAISLTEITTQEGEQVSITLPDKSVVALNSLSSIKYAPQDFCKDNREIEFEGEAHYKVAKDTRHPFIIHMQGMEIKVLGTEFNVINRKKEQTAEVALLNGSVMLTSLANGSTYTMKPNEIVVVNKLTGRMDVREVSHIEDACAWQKKQLVFRDASLGKVIRSLEKNYGVEIAVKMDTIEPFTGTLPNKNLTEALQIVSEAYQVKFSKTPAGKYVLR